jgi:hypothetical protein
LIHLIWMSWQSKCLWLQNHVFMVHSVCGSTSYRVFVPGQQPSDRSSRITRYVDTPVIFTMYLNSTFKCITKVMYLENSRHIIICNGGSYIWLIKNYLYWIVYFFSLFIF